MGAQDFYSRVSKTKAKTAREAFILARDEALAEYGHQQGYSGTIGSKHEYRIRDRMSGESMDQACARYEADRMYNDKFGPAICIEGPDEWVFIGTAPS